MSKPRKLTGTVEIAVMQQLSQQSAAWLIGITPRALRDHSDVPRRSDGNYDAHSLIEWAQSRLVPTKLSDSELERILTLLDSDELLTVPGVRVLDELQAKHGIGALLAFVVTLIEESKANHARYPNSYHPKTEKEIEDEVRNCRKHAEMLAKSYGLRISTVCEACGKLRRGRNWVSEDPPTDHCVSDWECPRCEKKREKREKQEMEKRYGRTKG